jgi:hypothetical protein
MSSGIYAQNAHQKENLFFDNLSLYNHYYKKHRGLNTTIKMSLSWQNQANQKAWGSSSSTKEMKWVRKTNNSSPSSASNKVDNPMSTQSYSWLLLLQKVLDCVIQQHL